MHYSLQSNRKTDEGKEDHPDRDAQFEYINDRVRRALAGSRPVISVDTKKKERRRRQQWISQALMEVRTTKPGGYHSVIHRGLSLSTGNE